MPRRPSILALCLSLASLTVLTACPRPDDAVVVAPTPKPPADPQLVELEAGLSMARLEPEVPAELFARFVVEGRPLGGLARPPVNLALALDASGSMQGKALRDAKLAAAAMIERLEPGDRLAIVAFGGRTELLFPAQPIAPETRAAAKSAIEGMQARGTTDLQGGLSRALSEVQAQLLPEGVNRVVLLSDGVPNEASGIDGLTQAARASGVTITALGLGIEFDETLLTRVSQGSGGRFHYLETSDEALAVFDEELLHMERVVARGMQLSLRAGPGVEIAEVVGHPGAAQGSSARVSLGDLADDERREVMVRLRAPRHADGSHAELVDAELDFEDVAVGAQGLQRSAYLSLGVGGERDEASVRASEGVHRAAVRALAAASIVEVAALARGGQLTEARARLEAARAAAEAAYAEQAEQAEQAKQEEQAEQADPALLALIEEMEVLAEHWPAQTAAIAVGEVQAERGAADAAGGPAPRPAPRRPDPRSVRRSHAKALEALQ